MLEKVLRGGLAASIVASLAFMPLPTEDEGCPTCKTGEIPTQVGGVGWTNWTAAPPNGVSVSFINPMQSNGQCDPPDSCPKIPCKFWGTFQIDTASVPLTNAQIKVGGVVVKGPGAVPGGGSRAKTYTDATALEVSCKIGNEPQKLPVEFSITHGTGNVCKTTLTLTCMPCQ